MAEILNSIESITRYAGGSADDGSTGVSGFWTQADKEPAWYIDADGTKNILNQCRSASSYWDRRSTVRPNSGGCPYAHQAKRNGFCLDRLDGLVRGEVQDSGAHWFQGRRSAHRTAGAHPYAK